MPELDSQYFLLLLGFFFIGAGIAGISGRYKRWYWTSKRLTFAYLPFGILFLLAVIERSITDATLRVVVRVSEFIFLGIAVWWLVRTPQFIIPSWIRQIESRPNAVYEAMAAAVKKGEKWQDRVNDPQSLEKWIRSVEKRLPKVSKNTG